eukprot:8746552-Karenia_brevis.AAC.1
MTYKIVEVTEDKIKLKAEGSKVGNLEITPDRAFKDLKPIASVQQLVCFIPKSMPENYESWTEKH